MPDNNETHLERVDKMFRNRPIFKDQSEAYHKLRRAHKQLALSLIDNVPHHRYREIGLDKVQEVFMWAIKGLQNEPKSE